VDNPVLTNWQKRLLEKYRIDVATASDEQILEVAAALVEVYLMNFALCLLCVFSEMQ